VACGMTKGYDSDKYTTPQGRKKGTYQEERKSGLEYGVPGDGCHRIPGRKQATVEGQNQTS